jgi:hypothetical protein
MDESLAALAQNGRLRAAMNLGNRALVQQSGGELRGVSPALARRLADEIGAALDPVIYEGAGKVYSIARLADRLVGQSDEVERGQPLADVHLDGDAVALGSEQDGGRD